MDLMKRRGGGWMAAVMGILVVFANACSRKDQQQQMMGGKPMDTSLNASIELLNPNDNRKVDSLVESIRSHAWEQTRQVVEMAKQKDPDEQSVQNARLVLLSLGDVGLTPLLDSLPSDSPEKLVWSLQTAVGFHRDNQARIVKILNQLLADKRQLPPHEQGPFTEEKIPDRRVCDEAYLLMRRLLAMEGEDDNMVNSRIFLYSMSGEERDKEIARLLNTKTWVALTEQAEAMPNVRE